jgi:hypothetical protein
VALVTGGISDISANLGCEELEVPARVVGEQGRDKSVSSTDFLPTDYNDAERSEDRYRVIV